jgi:hypothetical protein
MSTSSLSSPKGAATLTKRPNVSTRLSSASIESLYPTDRQVQFLHLEAEVETLLIQLQAIQQRRMTSKENIGPESTYESN